MFSFDGIINKTIYRASSDRRVEGRFLFFSYRLYYIIYAFCYNPKNTAPTKYYYYYVCTSILDTKPEIRKKINNHHQHNNTYRFVCTFSIYLTLETVVYRSRTEIGRFYLYIIII